MLKLDASQNGVIRLSGRFDASHVATARAVFDQVKETHTVDFADLEYISSAGLGVLLETQQRLNQAGHGLKLAQMNPHVKLVFEYAGFHLIFVIE